MRSFVLLLLLLGAGPDYVGCGNGPSVPSTGTPLPESSLDCMEDADCSSDVCADVRCVAGSCVEIGLSVDEDGDGQSPPPCGGDCDDTRPDIGDGFVEACDGLDNDCNMLIDDGAGPINRTYGLPVGDETTVVVAWDDHFVLTDLRRVALFGVPMSLGGELARPFEIMRLSSGAAFTDLRSATHSDGRILFVTQIDDSVLRYIVVRPDGDGLEVVEGPGTIETDFISIVDIDAIPFEDGFAVGVSGATPLDEERIITTDFESPPVVRLSGPITRPSFAIATDGTHLVMSDSEDGLHFFLPTTGEEVAGFTLTGLSRASHPIASWPGAVVAMVVSESTFDNELGLVDSVIGLGATEPAPEGAIASDYLIHTASDLVFFSQVRGTGVVVQPLESDLSTFADDRIVLADTVSGSFALRLSIAEGDVGMALGGGNPELGSAVAIRGGCASR